MMSLGSSCLSYMKLLRDPLEARGFEVAIFHATGMGGMAFEVLARQGYFVAVMDFAMQELANSMVGSVINAGSDRLTGAGSKGIPQIIAPGCSDLIDFVGWQETPPKYADRPFHEHNRLIKSSLLRPDERRTLIQDIVTRLQESKGPVNFILPTQGVEAWDKYGEPAYDPDGLSAMVDEVRQIIKPPLQLTEVDCHINDQAFADTALNILDDWVATGVVQCGI